MAGESRSSGGLVGLAEADTMAHWVVLHTHEHLEALVWDNLDRLDRHNLEESQVASHTADR